MKKLVFILAVLLAGIVPCVIAQTNQTMPVAPPASSLRSLDGTYTFQMVELKDYSVETNLNGQQVGFCNGIAVGYGCWDAITFHVLAGTITADGAGNITSGSYTMTADPNSYQCNPKNNPTDPCPVMVPSGNSYSPTASYSVGATIDYMVANVTRTFQAVRASTNKPPDWSGAPQNICNFALNNLDTCSWTQITQSLTNKNGSSIGTLVGTYTLQANGSGVMTLTPSNCGDCGSVQFEFVIAPVNQVGQAITLTGVSQLGNENSMVGSGVRIR